MPLRPRRSGTKVPSAPSLGWGSGARIRVPSSRSRGSATRIAASHFREAVQDSDAVCRIVVRYGEMLLIQVQQTAACNALHAVEARLSRWLLQARDRLDSNTIALTHEFLSQILGVRRTTVTVVACAAASRSHPLPSRADRDRGPAGARGTSLRMLRGDPPAD